MTISTVLFRFHGRINRRDYWLKGILPTLLIHISGGILAGMFLALVQISTADAADYMQPGGIDPLEFLIVVLLGILFAYMYLAVSAKRWHDIGKSAWWNMWLFVPVVGILIIIPLTIVLGVLPGKKEDNKHGVML